MVFSGCWYLLSGVSIIQIRCELKVLFLFSCLLFIPVRVIIAPLAGVGEDLQPLSCVSVSRISCFCMPCQGKTCSLGLLFPTACQERRVVYSFFRRVCAFIGTCSYVRRQVLVPNAKRWETGSWEVAGYLPAHACFWLWTYHPEGRVDVVYLLAWVLGVVGHSSWWPYSTLVS